MVRVRGEERTGIKRDPMEAHEVWYGRLGGSRMENMMEATAHEANQLWVRWDVIG